MRWEKLIALSVLSILLVASFSVVSLGNDGDGTEDTVVPDTYDIDEIISLNAKAEELIYSDPWLAEEYEQYKFDVASGAIVPMIALTTIVLGLAFTFLAGFIAGAIWGDRIINSNGNNQAYVDAVNQKFRLEEANKLLAKLDTARGIFESLLTIDSQLWTFTQPYWGLAMEHAVYNMWSLNGVYDPDAVMANSEFRDNLNYYSHNYQQTIDQTLNTQLYVNGNFVNARDFWSADPIYSSMRLGYVWDSGSLGMDATSGAVYTDACQIIVPSAGSDVAYIYTPEDMANALPTSYTIYCLGGSGQIASLSTGEVYTLTEGANLMPNLPSGLYRLSSGITWAGNFTPSAGAEAGILNGGMVFLSGSDIGYALVNPSTGLLNIVYNNQTYINSQALSYRVIYNSSASDGYYDIPLAGTIKGIASLENAMKNSVRTANVSASVLWNTYTAAEQSIPFLSPSSILPRINNVDLTKEQAFIIYNLAMQQVAQFYNDSTIANAGDLNISPESLDLVVYGNLYYRGQAVNGTDTLGGAPIPIVFTPYNYTRTITLSVGNNNNWDQAGLCMVWAQVSSFEEWNGITNLDNSELIALDDAYSMEIYRIVYKGEEVQSVTLEIEKMYELGLIDFTPVPSSNVPLPTGQDVAIAVLSVALAIFVYLYASRGTGKDTILFKPSTWKIIAIAVAIVGIVAPLLLQSLINWIAGFF